MLTPAVCTTLVAHLPGGIIALWFPILCILIEYFHTNVLEALTLPCSLSETSGFGREGISSGKDSLERATGGNGAGLGSTRAAEEARQTQ